MIRVLLKKAFVKLSLLDFEAAESDIKEAIAKIDSSSLNQCKISKLRPIDNWWTFT